MFNDDQTSGRFAHGWIGKAAAIAGIGSALVGLAATSNNRPHGSGARSFDSTSSNDIREQPLNAISYELPTEPRPECATPFPEAGTGSDAASDWAVDRYINGCSETLSERPWWSQNRGITSQSWYLGPDASRQIKEWMDSHEYGDEILAVGGFAACIRSGPVAGAVCAAVGAAVSDDWSDMKDAADAAVERNGCIKITDKHELWSTQSSVGPDNKHCRGLY